MQQQRRSGEWCCIRSLLPQKHPIWSSAWYRFHLQEERNTCQSQQEEFLLDHELGLPFLDYLWPWGMPFWLETQELGPAKQWRILHLPMPTENVPLSQEPAQSGSSQLILPRTTSDWMICERILARRSALNVDHHLVTTSWSNLWGALSLKAGESEAACALSSFAFACVECSKCPNFLIVSAHPGTPLAKWISIQWQHQTQWVC